MAKTLELQFATELGKTARVTIENPKEPMDEDVVKLSMGQITQWHICLFQRCERRRQQRD